MVLKQTFHQNIELPFGCPEEEGRREGERERGRGGGTETERGREGGRKGAGEWEGVLRCIRLTCSK